MLNVTAGKNKLENKIHVKMLKVRTLTMWVADLLRVLIKL